MKRRHASPGFSLAELLIVVAIIVVLAGVSFVAVQARQKAMHQAEVDSIAKEIYVAAQNHLIMAKSENYLGLKEESFGTPDNSTAEQGVYYIVKNSGSGIAPASAAQMEEVLLPVGAVDETVRTGNYIIRYQPKTAIVLDVFYCTPNSTTSSPGGRFSGELGDGDYSDLMALRGDGQKSGRAKYKNLIVGWYGGESAAQIPTGEPLEQPQIEIENADRLLVRVKDPNKSTAGEGVTLRLIVTGMGLDGKETNVKMAVDPKDYPYDVNQGGEWDYEIPLDDITKTGKHFCEWNAVNGDFVPGQDLKIQAVVFNTAAISNIAYSDEEFTNSLFERIEIDNTGVITAYINSIRHLENLEEDISQIKTTNSTLLGNGTSAAQFNLQKAVQTSDLNWVKFRESIDPANPLKVKIYTSDETPVPTAEGCYLPVSPDYELSYDGQYYNITGIAVVHTDDAGLFGKLENTNATTISNLALVDFSIETTGDAGALAGSLNKVNVTNVVAYNTKENDSACKIESSNGNAGGLIGSASDCAISKSAAALIVTSDNGDAGGLVGSTSRGSIEGCFSGGHTHDARYEIADPTTDYNVTGKNAVGGLVGRSVSTAISHSYSTCSATGATVGGLVGTSNAAITSCYCTGRVAMIGTASDGAKEGAFAGELSNTITPSECSYFEIINERPADAEHPYLPALGNRPDDTSVAKIDESADTYNAFVKTPSATAANKKTANAVYDPTLTTYYNGVDKDGNRICLFNLKTVKDLGANVKLDEVTDATGTTPADFVSTHYGDWPAPEIFIINEATN